jgi:transposase
MAPPLCRTPGVKGRRPVVGTRDRKHPPHVSAGVNSVSCAPHTDAAESRTGWYRLTGESKAGRLQRALAAHRRRPGKRYPEDRYARVVILIDNAPWHAGEPAQRALAEDPHSGLKRLPRYSPQLGVVERLWKRSRRRAAHNRLFDAVADLKRSIRASRCYSRTVRRRVETLIARCYPRPANQKTSTGTRIRQL